MRVLLTGAAGFIGTATACELRRHDVEVVAVDLLLPEAHGEATRATPPPDVHVLDTRRAGEWALKLDSGCGSFKLIYGVLLSVQNRFCIFRRLLPRNPERKILFPSDVFGC